MYWTAGFAVNDVYPSFDKKSALCGFALCARLAPCHPPTFDRGVQQYQFEGAAGLRHIDPCCGSSQKTIFQKPTHACIERQAFSLLCAKLVPFPSMGFDPPSKPRKRNSEILKHALPWQERIVGERRRRL